MSRPVNVIVEVVEGDVDAALKTMKRTLSRSGFWRTLKKHEAHMSPGARRRNKANRARRKQAKYERLRARHENWLIRNGVDDRVPARRKVVSAAAS